MPRYRIHSGSVFLDTDRSVATVVMESAELVVSQSENFNVVNSEFNKVYSYQNN